jgi:thioesterase domain-containing protein
MDKHELEKRILGGIPLSGCMAFEVVELSECSIQVKGNQQENINVHGTAFAGSLYGICTLAVWGLVYSRLPDNASLVMMNGHIDYLKPVKGDIVADASVDIVDMNAFLNELQDKRKCVINVNAQVTHDRQQAARFSASLYARMV